MLDGDQPTSGLVQGSRFSTAEIGPKLQHSGNERDIVRAQKRWFLYFLVLVLSETVLVLERMMMSEPSFDHERIVSMLTRLIQRTESVAEGLIEYEYREAEYEYEESPNKAMEAERRSTRF